MADTKIVDLTELTVPDGEAVLYVVGDPGGTPVDRKITLANVRRDRAWARGATPNAADDEFNDESLDGAWTTILPSGSLTATESADVLSVKCSGQSTEHAACVVKAFPGGFTYGNYIETAIRMLTRQSYIMAGLVMTDGTTTTSKCTWMMPYSYYYSTAIDHRSGVINASKPQHYGFIGVGVIGLIYQRLTWLAANTFKSEWSIDGVTWTRFGTSDASYTMTPTHMGFGFSTWGGSYDSLVTAEYFRVG